MTDAIFGVAWKSLIGKEELNLSTWQELLPSREFGPVALYSRGSLMFYEFKFERKSNC